MGTTERRGGGGLNEKVFSAAHLMIARRDLERLAADCLQASLTAAFVLAGNNPDKFDPAEAGRIAVAVAATIRGDVALRIEKLLADEEGRAFLERLALDAGCDMRERSK
jgi:hypothetical protein